MQNENKAYPMSRLLEALHLEQTLEQRVEAYMISQKEVLGKIADQCENKDPYAYQPGGDGDDFTRLKELNPFERLCVVLIRACNVWKRYQEKEIPESVYLNTMTDIRIWCENASNSGLENSNWFHNHVSYF